MEILDRYIEQLLKESTPQAPMWNIEKIKAGKKPSWNYIDGCMIKAVVELVSNYRETLLPGICRSFYQLFRQ